ncbi:hypothetical protein COT72_02915 [archaeon CG10_big_fil_rev_8_21_14_0_10_43_11]|nr:MAG: hypothetical protein COT72_02915 [archaeon CG10_big_fil_rev_8_21_14_0_10_43_11]
MTPMKKRVTKQRILIVDDEPDIRSMLKVLLEKEGFQISTAVDGDDCLRKLKNDNADLVLLDIMMPGTPVKEILPKIKTNVLFLSVIRVSEAEREDLLKGSNIVGFVQKPFDVKQLLEKIKQVLSL